MSFLSFLMFLRLCRLVYIPLAHRGDAANELKDLMSMHFRSFWKLRQWAVSEKTQLFALTEKALFVRVFLWRLRVFW